MSGSPPKTTIRWNEVLDLLKNRDSPSFNVAVELKPIICTRRRIELYSDLEGEAARDLIFAIKQASKLLWEYTITATLVPYPEGGGIMPGQPEPDMVMFQKSPTKYPIYARVIAHYPNDRRILTTAGVCKCGSARDFRIGLKVPVYMDEGSLSIRKSPRTPYRY